VEGRGWHNLGVWENSGGVCLKYTKQKAGSEVLPCKASQRTRRAQTKEKKKMASAGRPSGAKKGFHFRRGVAGTMDNDDVGLESITRVQDSADWLGRGWDSLQY